MHFADIHLSPELLEESRRELERERALQRRIKEARAARRAARPSRFASLTARLRHTPQPAPVRPAVVDTC
jgi:hypothetical protein